jgi:FG-GAP-like repeat
LLNIHILKIMADISLGQSITGLLTSDDLKYTSGSAVYDRYNFTDLDNFRQLTINVTRPVGKSFEIILRNSTTGKIIAATTNYFGSGSASISATTFPGINYGIEVNDAADANIIVANSFGSYTLSTVDGGKATSIVTTSKVQKNLNNIGIPGVGTIGADGKFFPLASGNILGDVALSPNGQFYGIGFNSGIAYRIDPSQYLGNQVDYANGIGSLSVIKDINGFNLSGTIDAIEFANNQLYALDRTTTGDKLYTIDINRVATLVGDLPPGLLNKGGDMVYDAPNRRFLVTAEGLPNNDALWQIPIDNPAGATKLGLIGFADVTGINFEYGQLTGFTGGTNPTKIRIDAASGTGTIATSISGITNISGSATIPTPNTRSDFNGDGKSDIVWRNDNGTTALWQMNGSTVTVNNIVASLSSDWKTAGTGDFNGDKKSDVVWRNDNGAIALWQMNGSTVTANNIVASLSSDWKASGTGDFGGDGKSDIVWRNDNGAVALWQMNGATVTKNNIVASLSSDWKASSTGDFNGDNKADLLWRNDNGAIALWQMNGDTVTSSKIVASLSSDWKAAGTGDFNGDGKADMLWRNDNGAVAMWQMDGATVVSSKIVDTLSSDWKSAGIGDFNGDGKSDMLWRNDNGANALWQMNGSTVSASLLIPSLDPTWKIAAPIL